MSETKTAVVCQRHQDPEVRRVWPDAMIVHPVSCVTGHRFDRVIMLWRPDMMEGFAALSAAMSWHKESLMCRLKPGGDLVWLC